MTLPASSVGTTAAITVLRIRFVDQAPPGAKVRRTFREPRPAVAVEETMALAELPMTRSWPEPVDHLIVVLVPRSAANDWQKRGADWLAPPEHPDAAPAVILERKGLKVEWRPGRAVVQGHLDTVDTLLAGLIDFAFYEGQLRVLETALQASETSASTDVAWAYRIDERHSEHWIRFGETIEQLARLRLQFAHLQPHLAHASRTLPPAARRLVQRLHARTDVPPRLEALSDRLEALEDLYEGASDRIADYRWWRRGHRLEVWIIILLLVEVALMSADLVVRFLEYYFPPE